MIATAQRLEELGRGLPQAARDTKVNLKTVLKTEHLSPYRAWGIALACAYNENPTPLVEAILEDGAEHLDEAMIEDTQAAAALMSMNNVYYRFRHMIGKDSYNAMPARLRMTRIGKPATSRLDFELLSLAVSAINGCEMCIRSHEEALVGGDVGEEEVHEAVRIASVIRSAAVALKI